MRESDLRINGGSRRQPLSFFPAANPAGQHRKVGVAMFPPTLTDNDKPGERFPVTSLVLLGERAAMAEALPAPRAVPQRDVVSEPYRKWSNLPSWSSSPQGSLNRCQTVQPYRQANQGMQCRRVPNPRAKNNWLVRHASNVTSQAGEDGIIEKVFGGVRVTTHHCLFTIPLYSQHSLRHFPTVADLRGHARTGEWATMGRGVWGKRQLYLRGPLDVHVPQLLTSFSFHLLGPGVGRLLPLAFMESAEQG